MRRTKLREARGIKNWTLEQAAEQVGCAPNTLHRWESGKNIPSAFNRDKLCKVYGMNVQELGLIDTEEQEFKQKNTMANGKLSYITMKDMVLAQSDHRQLPESPITRDNSWTQVNTTWFDLKQQLIKALANQWNGRAMYCDELQVIIDQELRMFDLIQSLYQQDSYQLSRRTVLTSIAALPFASSLNQNHFQSPENFLPQCTASITSCWYLLNGDNISIIESSISAYLPALIDWARRTSRYQRPAAYLAAQACLLMDLVAYHRLQFQESLSYAYQAVKLAQISGDSNLCAYALILLGGAHNLNGQVGAMLQKHQEATSLLSTITPALQSYVLAELAYAYAQNGMVKEALHAIGEARTRFPGVFGEVPCFVSADFGLSQLIIFEGLTHITLGQNDPSHSHTHYQQATSALSQIETVPRETPVPQRLRVEITNYQTQAAIHIGELDNFERFLGEGLKGAMLIGSEKRRQEVIANWQLAYQKWPHETRVNALAELFLP